jgi:hypothetical protein
MTRTKHELSSMVGSMHRAQKIVTEHAQQRILGQNIALGVDGFFPRFY